MPKENLLISKSEWRKTLLERRKALSEERRLSAAKLLYERLQSLKGNILSFTPRGSEIDLLSLNRLFAQEERLFLVPYLSDQPLLVPLANIHVILVPGLGFDQEKYRIGYGQGYYDRLLACIPKILSIGVGFKEQLTEELLPRDSWDIPLQELVLV